MIYTLEDGYSETIIESIADSQGEIFQEAVNQGYDLKDFTYKYMKSYFCEDYMDTDYSPNQTETGITNIELFLVLSKKQGIELLKAKNSQSDMEDAYWIGYMYRRLFFEYNWMSKDIIELLDYDTMKEYSKSFENYEYNDMIKQIFKDLNLTVG